MTDIIDMTPDTIGNYGVCGYKDVTKHAELRNKIEWFTNYYQKGLRIKAFVSAKDGYQGMIEYIPGKYAHRPVEAEEYLFIHCLFVGFKNEYKGKGHASRLLEECMEDARQQGAKGVAVVTRKGSFMAGSDLFIKKGFQLVDSAEPDFSLLVYKFDPSAKNPRFKATMIDALIPYAEGLTILRSPQCPYTEKNVSAILETANATFHLATKLVDLKDAESAQQSPCAFGTFCIIYKGEIISYHPISKTRFESIMRTKLS